MQSMIKTSLITSLITALLASYSVQATASQAISTTNQGPAAQTLAMIEALKQVKKNDIATYNKVDLFINYTLLTRDSISIHKAKFNEAQLKKFTVLFEELIKKVAYPQSSAFYEEAQVSYQDPVIKGNKALVISETTIEKEDFEMEIGYTLTNTKKDMKDNWQLSDLLVDEDSLVKDYQNQFGRIINKEGVDGLIKRIENKIAEIDAEK